MCLTRSAGSLLEESRRRSTSGSTVTCVAFCLYLFARDLSFVLFLDLASQGAYGKKILESVRYGKLLFYLSSCIAWRFAVLELQSFLVELINNFEFSLTPEAQMVRRESCFVMAPTIEGQVEKGNQLPLLVKLASQEED